MNKQTLFFSFFIVLSGFFLDDLSMLSDVHWDTPVYLGRATSSPISVISKFRERRKIIAHEVQAIQEMSSSGVVHFHQEYHSFLRLGNLLLLASINQLTEDPYYVLALAIALYRTIYAAALMLLVWTALRLRESLAPQITPKHWALAVLGSLVLHVYSVMFVHMSGNLVSEVPALFFLAAFMALMVHSVQKASVVYAALAGCFLFAVYLTKYNEVWAGVTFLFVYILVLPATLWRSVFQLFLVAGLTAVAFYSFYIFIYFPLPMPSMFLAFSSALETESAGIKTRDVLNVLLVVGFFLPFAVVGVCLVGRNRMARLGGLWTLLMLLPLVWVLSQGLGRNVQARQHLSLVAPMFILSASGMALFVRMAFQSLRNVRWIIGFGFLGVFFLLTIYHPHVYSFLRYSLCCGGYNT